MNPVFISVVAVAFVAGGQSVRAAESDWHWIKVEPQDNHSPVSWTVTEGAASVAIHGRTFKADLKLDPGTKAGADIRLEGAISKGTISATETVIGTDEAPFSITGYMTKTGYPFETDRIIFADGANFMGMTRIIQIGSWKQDPHACAGIARLAASKNPVEAAYNKAMLGKLGCPDSN